MTSVRPPPTTRDLFNPPESAEAAEQPAERTAAFEEYAQSVFAALHEGPGQDR